MQNFSYLVQGNIFKLGVKWKASVLVGRVRVDDLTPLPAICSETPDRVNAGAEGLDVPGHGSQPCITRKSSRSSPSCRRVAHCSYHDHMVVFLILSFSQVAKKLKSSQLGGSGAACGSLLLTPAFVTWRMYGIRRILFWHHMSKASILS